MYEILDFLDFNDHWNGFILANMNAAQVQKHLSNCYIPVGLNERDGVSLMWDFLILWGSFAVSVQFQQPIIICLAPKRMSTFILAFLLANIHLIQQNFTKKTQENLYEWHKWGFKTGITKFPLGMRVSCVSRMSWNCVKSWKQIISSHKYEKSWRLIWGMFAINAKGGGHKGKL